MLVVALIVFIYPFLHVFTSANLCGNTENSTIRVNGFVQELLVSMSPMSPMDAYGGTPRSGYHRTLTHTPSMDRRGPSPSVLQHRVVAERKWVLGVQVFLYHFKVDGS